MLTKSFIAAGALLSMVAAVPMQKQNKRDIVWETKIESEIVTMEVTTTVWLSAGETAPATAPHYGHGHGHSHKSTVTSHIKSTVTVPAASPSSPAETSAAPTYVAPTTSSSTELPLTQAPATSTWTSAASATTSAAAATSLASKSGSSGSDGLSGAAAAGTSYTGDLTWYDTGLGACGITNTASDHIVAVSELLFDQYATANPNDNPLCGLTVDITGVDGSVYPATIVDRCTGCALADLDLSEDFFNTVTDNGDGRVHGMSWTFA